MAEAVWVSPKQMSAVPQGPLSGETHPRGRAALRWAPGDRTSPPILNGADPCDQEDIMEMTQCDLYNWVIEDIVLLGEATCHLTRTVKVACE